MGVHEVVWDIDLGSFIGKLVRIVTCEGIHRRARIERFAHAKLMLDGEAYKVYTDVILEDGSRIPLTGLTMDRVRG